MKKLLKRILGWSRFFISPIFPYFYEDVAFHNDILWKDFVRKTVDTLNFDAIYETGTFLGSTTLWLSKLHKSVYTCEIEPLYYARAKKRFAQTNITAFLQPSYQFLANIYHKIFPLIYLDAHWGNNPLALELQLCNKFEKAVIMIDDFDANGLPHDEGLNIDVVKVNLVGDYKVYYPNYAAPRGYCVIFKGIEPLNTENLELAYSTENQKIQ